LTLLS